MNLVEIVLLLVGLHLATGLVVGVAFVARGAAAVDPAASGSGWGFKLFILPGAVALWPVVAARWAQAARGPRSADPAARLTRGARRVHRLAWPAVGIAAGVVVVLALAGRATVDPAATDSLPSAPPATPEVAP